MASSKQNFPKPPAGLEKTGLRVRKVGGVPEQRTAASPSPTRASSRPKTTKQANTSDMTTHSNARSSAPGINGKGVKPGKGK